MEDGDEPLLRFAHAISEGQRPWSRPDLQMAFASRLRNGEDPLGSRYSAVRSAKARRSIGAVFTPPRIVDAMIAWAQREAAILGEPRRIVDPGAGTGRFTLAAARAFPDARLVAVENDPDLLILLRANVTELGLREHVSILADDFRSIILDLIDGPTLFVGNPPYLRHHQIDAMWKRWYVEVCARHGARASQLAGAHLHFFAKIADIGREGDYGCLITAAEWLDVGYGAALRSLLADVLGGSEIHILAPTAEAFPGTMTTAAVTTFRIGRRPPVLRLRKVTARSGFDRLDGGRAVDWNVASRSPKWSGLFRKAKSAPAGFVELGELCRVHRGQVTGANRVWIGGKHTEDLPKSVLKPTVTRAAQLFAAGVSLDDDGNLARVVDLPPDLDRLPVEYRASAERFIAWARSAGAEDTYIARHRSPWWAVRLAEPAPIICTYMARRTPAFVRNRAGARLLNIAHGIYPRDCFGERELVALAAALREAVRCEHGRTYAGGLIKFEPREIERIPIRWPRANG